MGDQIASGLLYVTSWALRFESEAGQFEWRTDDVLVALEPGKDGAAVFSHPIETEASIRVPDRAILDHVVFKQNNHLRLQLKELRQRGEGRRALAITAVFLAGVVLVSLLVISLSGWVVHRLAAQVPTAWEAEFGDKLLAEIKAEANIQDDHKAIADLNRLTEPLLRILPKQATAFRFHVMKDEMPNAFALPGGHIVVNTGLLDATERPEQLAGVLAHEIAHVTQRHSFRQIISAAGPSFAASIVFGDSGGVVGLLSRSSAILVHQSFSREFEHEADDVAWDYLVDANIDPRGLEEFLQKIKAEEARFEKFLNQAWSSHPATEERIRRLESKWRNSKRKSGFMELEPVGE